MRYVSDLPAMTETEEKLRWMLRGDNFNIQIQSKSPSSWCLTLPALFWVFWGVKEMWILNDSHGSFTDAS